MLGRPSLQKPVGKQASVGSLRSAAAVTWDRMEPPPSRSSSIIKRGRASEASSNRASVGPSFDAQEKRKSMIETSELLQRAADSTNEIDDVPWIHRKSASAVFASFIILNALLIGVEVDIHEDNGFSHEDPDDLVWLAVECAFILAFSVEFLLRLHADGICVFRDYWNCFDLCLISIGIVENVLMTISTVDINLTFMRLLRLVRLARIVRMVRFFKALFLLLQGMFNALRTIMWMLILLWSFIYLGAIIVRQTVTEGELMQTYYKSTPRAMITFFQLSTVEDWPVIYRATVAEYPVLGILIIAFIFFTHMLLLNLITGVIVENTLEITRTDEEEQLQQLDAMRINCLKEFEALLMASDLNSNGLLERDELEQLLDVTASSKPDEKAAFLVRAMHTLTEERSCAILKWFPASDLLQLFDICDAKMDGDHAVPFEDFLSIISRSIGVRGGVARAQDQILGQYEVLGVLQKAKESLLESCDEAMAKTLDHLDGELSKVDEVAMEALEETDQRVRDFSARLDGELQEAFERLCSLATEVLCPDTSAPQHHDNSPERTGAEPTRSVNGSDPGMPGVETCPEIFRLPSVPPVHDLCIPLTQEDAEALSTLEERVDGLVALLFKLVHAFRGEVAFSSGLVRDKGPPSIGGFLQELQLLQQTLPSSKGPHPESA